MIERRLSFRTCKSLSWHTPKPSESEQYKILDDIFEQTTTHLVPPTDTASSDASLTHSSDSLIADSNAFDECDYF
ncbi:hypothetical protein EON65_59080 [archaeon]|nr:MAG: hypothetical protein EON65_59080 [archaeon]